MDELIESLADRRTLCVSRYPGQRTFVQGGIVITISKIEGGRVYLQIEAPMDVEISGPPKDADLTDRVRRGR
jgi:hypothetical protein